MKTEDLKNSVRAIPDYPKPGINFRDITTVLSDKRLFQFMINQMCIPWENQSIDAVLGIESRGFIMGSAIAYKLNSAFVPLRKPDKLPYKTFSAAYDLEYGSTEMHIHTDALDNFQNVIIIDDLLATGGTALAAAKLIEKFDKKNILGAAFFIDLT
ncbi:MAG: adenine phosphoribosyltransferase, partial [Burkholderiaceae bacterium]